MISIQKLMQNLSQCRVSNLALPKSNDDESNPFVQKTAIDLRRIELESVNEVFANLTEANYTMDKELEKLNDNLRMDSSTTQSYLVSSTKNIPSESLIIYNENETAPLPEILLPMLDIIQANKEEWYIYGVKNPESFYKSFMLLTRIDFIIKNKTEKKNEVATFKREMAMHYENFYKALNYRAHRFAHIDMVHKLTSIDNYCEYDALRYMADYSRVNMIILDVVGKKYIDIHYTPNQLQTDNKASAPSNTSQSKESANNNQYIIIIKYANDTYLPLMNSNGIHHLDNRILTGYISSNFERITLTRFKETIPTVIDSGLTNSNAVDEEVEASDSSNNEITFSDVEGEEQINTPVPLPATGNILESSTVSVFFNNTPSSKPVSKVNREPIIKTGTLSIAIEDMIEISESSNTPSVTVEDLQTIQHANIASIINQEPESTSKLETASTEGDILAELMNKIPSANNLSKSSKKKAETTIPKAVITPKQSSTANPGTANPASTKPMMEEIKPLKTYNLLDLQILAKLYKVDHQKEGKSGKKINKTKEEIYNELLEYQAKRK